MKKFILFLSLVLCFQIAHSSIIQDTLYINKDTITIANVNVQMCVFNDSSFFKAENFTFELGTNDTLDLHIINNDTLDHTFTIDGLISTGNVILANSSADFSVELPTDGAYRFYSDVTYGHFLGASGLIMKGYSAYSKFYWNMFEQNGQLSYDFADLSATTTPANYVPDLFTINLDVHPNLQLDPLAKVIGNVGDTLIITVANSGQMEHTLHFHGYHVEILDASLNTKMNGWSKDTFPIELGEVIVMELIPHQEGTYPVHEHNLINVTSSGSYPGGMLNLIDIQP